MGIDISTTIYVSDGLALEILNTAISGACDSWALITDKEHDPLCSHIAKAARFTSRTAPSTSMVVTDVAVGGALQYILSNGGEQISPLLRSKILRAIINDAICEVDAEMSDYVIRAAVLT